MGEVGWGFRMHSLESKRSKLELDGQLDWHCLVTPCVSRRVMVWRRLWRWLDATSASSEWLNRTCVTTNTTSGRLIMLTTASWNFASDAASTAGSWEVSSNTAGSDVAQFHLNRHSFWCSCLLYIFFLVGFVESLPLGLPDFIYTLFVAWTHSTLVWRRLLYASFVSFLYILSFNTRPK